MTSDCHKLHCTGKILDFSRRPLLMGILNVTSDSFSDGGLYQDTEEAVTRGLELSARGADLLDIGGESTRPGFTPVSLDEELSRVLPVITRLADQVSCPISIDTSKAEVARQALAAGAVLVNDVTALADPAMPAVIRASGAGLILMDQQPLPPDLSGPDEIIAAVASHLRERCTFAVSQGIAPESIAIDPGIGFGKTQPQNLAILQKLPALQVLGHPVLLGMSRKSILGFLTGQNQPERRDGATIGAAIAAVLSHSVQILRIHEPEQLRDALTTFNAIRK